LKATIGPQNFSTIFDFQPLPSYFVDIGVQKGGNVLGLERDSRNKIVFASGVSLLSSNSDEQHPRVFQKVAALNQRVEAFSKSVGSSEEFVYLPYANALQDPIGSYGAANVEYIRQVAKKYDPRGFFQSRVPGGFKIDRVD
jgi:hypothetical protein